MVAGFRCRFSHVFVNPLMQFLTFLLRKMLRHFCLCWIFDGSMWCWYMLIFYDIVWWFSEMVVSPNYLVSVRIVHCNFWDSTFVETPMISSLWLRQWWKIMINRYQWPRWMICRMMLRMMVSMDVSWVYSWDFTPSGWLSSDVSHAWDELEMWKINGRSYLLFSRDSPFHMIYNMIIDYNCICHIHTLHK